MNFQAYINKERAAQIAEKNLQSRQEEQMRQQEIQDMLHEKQYLEDLERKEYLDDQISKIRYQQQLDEQLKIREQEKINIYKQFLKEKEQIDEVVRKIKRENEEKIVIQMEQKLATKQQIEEFKKSQIVWREIEERKILEENEQIKKFIELKESRDSEFSRIQKERRQIKNESVLRLADDIRKQQDIEREREEILYELNHGRKMEEERFKEQLEEEENITLSASYPGTKSCIQLLRQALRTF